MSDELRIILATLGTISTLVLIPIIGLRLWNSIS